MKRGEKTKSYLGAIKSGGQSYSIPFIYDETVLKCLMYVSNKQIECLEQF